MTLDTVNYLFALGTVALQIITTLLIFSYLFRARTPLFNDIAAVAARFGFVAAFLVSFTAAVLNFYYSDILGVEACPLCWWQRIFLYPQIVLFAFALWNKDSRIALYSIALSVIGVSIALYQHVLQMLPGSGLPCPATGVSCAQRVLFEFGYITYPLMALSLFAFLIVAMLFVRRR